MKIAKKKRVVENPYKTPPLQFKPAALKLKQAGEYLGGISTPTMHRLIRRGELVPIRKLRHMLFRIDELDRFLNT
jgi:Helix-turn-helix domain